VRGRSEYLYAQCSCADFEYRQNRLYEHADFAKRFEQSRRVHVARHKDFLVPPEMTDERDGRWAVWRDEMNILYAQTVTRDQVSRTNRVSVTLESGAPTEWVCKHILCVARWIARHKWQATHVRTCWRGDEDVRAAVAWSKHQAGDGWVKPKWLQLTQDVFVIAWEFGNKNVLGSNLFEQKGER